MTGTRLAVIIAAPTDSGRGIDVRTATGYAPNMAILFTSVLWGTLWIPMREMNEAGLGGPAATTVSFLLGLLVVLPLGLAKARRILTGGWDMWIGGFFVAVSIALFAEGVVRGQVARVMLLFYLTPVWSTILGRLMLGAPITRRRLATIALGLTGMAVILGGEAGLPVPRSVADWMGLGSGLLWAVAAVYVNRSASRPLFDRIFVPLVFLAPAYYLLTVVPGARDSLGIEGVLVGNAAVMLALLALVWIVPIVGLTIFGAGLLDPGRVAILLMFEIVVGLGSVALLLDEPVGLREVAGAVLIGAAILAEFVAKPAVRATAPPITGR